MTLETLENAKDLKDYVEELKDKIKKAEATANSTVALLSAAPGAATVSDKVGRGATEISYLKHELMIKCMELRCVYRWINDIDPLVTRKIFIRKYLCGDSMRRISRDFGFDRRELKALIEKALSSLLQEV